ncbi:cathepsin propeptide inhibitor domain I29 [Nitzschia inconspicua]|uniref:Cathepsin propeptide inhibitor domain I29 n=1 Tax=Nitzschia inconspicua TaxID=303405 RepID=A0A9K3KZU9_9STRA|nr:cathepsin propeptide inhibitor domain I29 [Nitzschia inconspicua]
MRRMLTLRSSIGNILLLALVGLAFFSTLKICVSYPYYIHTRKSRPLCWWNPNAVASQRVSISYSEDNKRFSDRLHATPVKSANTAFDASPEDNTKEDELRRAYESWRLEYRREFDPERYQNFRINYLKLTAANAAELKNARENGRPDPIPLSLNEYGDYSAEEYKKIQMDDPSMSSTPISSKRSPLFTNVYSSESPQEQQRIRQAYQEWCFANGKPIDESRLEIFAFNFKVVENYYKKTGKKAELNRYADLSPEEYKAATEGAKAGAAISSDDASSSGTDALYNEKQQRDQLDRERIRNAYMDWCNENGREYQESRLDIFASNLNAVERYRRETGKVVKLNKYADLSPDEYREAVAGESTRGAGGVPSYPGTTGTTESASTAPTMRNNPMSSYLENLNNPTQQISLKVEDRIRKIYLDWCQYYGKVPDEGRLEIFAANLVVLEKHHLETGEELTLNEFADQTQGGSKTEQAQVEEIKRTEEVRLEKERAEQAALEAERRQNQEQALLENERKKAEERKQIEMETKWQEESKRLQLEKGMVDEQRMEQDRQNVETPPIQIQENFAEETSDVTDKWETQMKKDSGVESTLQVNPSGDVGSKQSDEEKSTPNTIALPRSSYMDAVARTWIDRSAYLESLQQGKTGVLPEPPPTQSPWEEDQVDMEYSKQPTSLINSIWDFINDTRRSASEQYAKRLIAEADEMIADANKSSDIGDTELRYLQEAVDALRRRKDDEQRAQRARTEAKEWEQIQRGLEKEAKLAKKRREYEERMAAEARQKAQSMESSTAGDASTEFSFLPNPFKATEGNSPFQPNFPPMPSVDNNIFSFLGGNSEERRPRSPKSLTQPVVEKKESWLTFLFDFFGANRQPEEPGQGTITLEPAKRTTVFDFFVSPEMFAQKQPGRGSITIEEPKKPSIFSFFAKFGDRDGPQETDPQRRKRLEEYERRRRTRQEKLSWLEEGRSRILEESDRNLSRKEARRLQRELEELAAGNITAMDPNIPQLAKWTKTPDGRITGYVADTTRKFKMGTKITTSRIKGQVIKAGVTVTTTSGSQYRLGLPLSLASEGSRRTDGGQATPDNRRATIPPFRFPFGGVFGDPDVPSLVEWTQNEDGTITGFVNNKIGFEDGTQITTSPVDLGVQSGMTVQTRGGSKYKLLKERR